MPVQLRRHLTTAAFVVLFAAIPLAMVSSRFGLGPLDLVDFRNLWRAAHDVLAGRTLYHPAPDPSRPLTADCLGPGPDCFVYPPLTAVLAVPFTLLPFSAAAVLFYVSDVAALLAALRVAGLRDWRCYGVALACWPALASFESATITPFLALGLALGWRYRDRRSVASLALGAVVIAKLFLWPLAFWLLATRRFSTAVSTVVAACGLCLATWAPIGFAGFGGYPHLLRALTGLWQSHAYSPVALGLALGLPTRAASVLGFAAGGAVLALAARAARRPDGDQASFALTIAAALLLSPLVWLNYFALLLVPLAIARPTLTRAWALTLPFMLLPGMSDGHVQRILVSLVLLAGITYVAAGPRESDLPEPVADERYALPRLANADGL